ncbi:MAG: translation elongation factor 4 [Ruthenibacterium lactatiformans]|nr:translation elongation factor 4 [Ruthenibacterium lactatiformans]MDY4944470.1 translation elongation factor 4 [Ruthenibacterium lactatiformans]
MAQKNIRNFCIIAHIDHGKSTLADRILECTQAVDERQMEAQLLDNMELERERGITIKARAVTLHYTAKNGQDYEFNLIDTPGHVDFNYEVSRSLAACEGAVLVVDASQGVEAQTLANTYLALEHDLELVPILNKIDLPSAEPDRVAHEVEDVIGLPCMDAPRVSAKMGVGIQDVLERVITDIPAPKGDADAPLKALIFDAVYDPYKGVIVYLRVFDGRLSVGEPVKLMQTGAQFTPVEVGHMGATALAPCGTLEAGEVGYFTASIKTLEDTRVGDTITGVSAPTAEALPGYRKVTPMVFCGIYPADGADYPDLKDALEKLRLNDASLSFDAETSVALGFGFRCGFLGLLHLEIIIERLEREFDLDLITTAPSVEYRITLTDGAVKLIDNPTNYPDPAQIAKAEEPFVDAHIYTPTDYVGSLMELCQNRRGIMRDMKYMDATRVDLHYELPLGEIVYDFFDAIKSRSRGYASYDYEMKGFVESKLVKLDILLNGDMVDALSMIVHADTAYAKGRRLAEKLKENIPRQMFEIPIQAAIGGKIIARETVKAMRKDVLAKCYGGDITRKKKLLEKQKEGKKKMRQLGTVQVPSEAFTAVLKLDE